MSKIGKINISIPEKVKVALAGNIINIEGPLGKKSINVDLDMFNLDIIEGKEISIKPKKVDQNSKRLWGMNRSLINNAVIGSSTGYEKTLELLLSLFLTLNFFLCTVLNFIISVYPLSLKSIELFL